MHPPTMTNYRRRQYRDRKSPDMSDLSLAFASGVITATVCALLVFTFFLRSPC